MTIALQLPLSRATLRFAVLGTVLAAGVPGAAGPADGATPTTVRVAFLSTATNPVPRDTNDNIDMFVRVR